MLVGVRRWRGVPLLALSSTMARCSAARSAFDDGAVIRCPLVNLREVFVIATSLEIISTSYVTVLVPTLTVSGDVDSVGSVCNNLYHHLKLK